jgi:hypothetical protein
LSMKNNDILNKAKNLSELESHCFQNRDLG